MKYSPWNILIWPHFLHTRFLINYQWCSWSWTKPNIVFRSPNIFQHITTPLRGLCILLNNFLLLLKCFGNLFLLLNCSDNFFLLLNYFINCFFNCFVNCLGNCFVSFFLCLLSLYSIRYGIAHLRLCILGWLAFKGCHHLFKKCIWIWVNCKRQLPKNNEADHDTLRQDA